ncbi:MAG: hypothetical protein ACRDHK_09995, partial [Actinomycetota bacterium]
MALEAVPVETLEPVEAIDASNAAGPAHLDGSEDSLAEPAPPPPEVDLRVAADEATPSPTVRSFQPGTYDIEVRVLGPVEIVGGEQSVEAGKPTEVVVYLATHPAGVDSDRLRTALWPRDRLPAPKTFSNAVSKSRLALGARHLPHAANERYRLEPTVTTDLAR